MRPTPLALGIASLLAGCRKPQPEITTFSLPDAELSSTRVDFGEVSWGETVTREVRLTNRGEVPMGVSEIALLEEGMEQNFSLTWSAAAIQCEEGGDQASSARRAVVDTGSPHDSGTGGSGGGSDTAGGGGTDTGASGEVLVLDPGCTLPIHVTMNPVQVGEIHAAFAVHTVTEPDTDDPSYFRDPDQFKRVVLLEGTSVRGFGNIVVKSPSVDVGHAYTGETATAEVSVYNVGDGELTLYEPQLGDDCDTDFSLDLSLYKTDEPLAPGESTLFTIVFTPTDLDPARCTVLVLSDDQDQPEVDVNVRGNYGDDPEDEPPTVAIRSPEVGYRHTTADPLVLEINVFDKNQPANTLYCKVRSYLAGGKVADCTPPDESGHVFVEIPIEDLEEGTDTLRVEVTDQAENRVYATTTVLWRQDYPDSDDDGDGWGDDDPTDTEHYDCDDGDPAVYPYAAEIYDGKDNDCDGGVDEGTLGTDDDGDAVSEIDGDCDDRDPDTYPGAPEQPDLKDNDCDGIVDEGTSLYDDDGDGFTENDLDCDDRDPDINPAAEEICDGIDNNCNGLRDDQEGCTEIDSKPMIVGGIQMSQTAIGVGESTTMSVYVYEADGQNVTYSWQEDTDLTAQGHTAIDNPTAQAITWTAPSELPAGSDGEVYSVYVVVTDEDGNQDWEFDEIWVYPEPVATTGEKVTVPERSGCFGGASSEASGDTSAAGIAPIASLLGLLAAARRRRRRRERAEG